MEKELAMEYIDITITDEKAKRLSEVKNTMKILRDIMVETAKDRLKLPKGRRVINAKALKDIVLKQWTIKTLNPPPPSLFPLLQFGCLLVSLA